MATQLEDIACISWATAAPAVIVLADCFIWMAIFSPGICHILALLAIPYQQVLTRAINQPPSCCHCSAVTVAVTGLLVVGGCHQAVAVLATSVRRRLRHPLRACPWDNVCWSWWKVCRRQRRVKLPLLTQRSPVDLRLTQLSHSEPGRAPSPPRGTVPGGAGARVLLEARVAAGD